MWSITLIVISKPYPTVTKGVTVWKVALWHFKCSIFINCRKITSRGTTLMSLPSYVVGKMNLFTWMCGRWLQFHKLADLCCHMHPVVIIIIAACDYTFTTTHWKRERMEKSRFADDNCAHQKRSISTMDVKKIDGQQRCCWQRSQYGVCCGRYGNLLVNHRFMVCIALFLSSAVNNQRSYRHRTLRTLKIPMPSSTCIIIRNGLTAFRMEAHSSYHINVA